MEIIMFVPAMAFAWWLVAMPVRSTAVTTRAVPRSDDTAETEATLEPNADVQDDRNTPDESAPTEPTETTGERVKLRGTITPEIVRLAQSFLDLPMGTERAVDAAGRHLVFVLEWHYHPPGHVGGPKGWHKGVTVYERK
jgi:hypothetical protein